MDLSLFHPNSSGQNKDKLAEGLRSAARYILIIVAGLIPIIFIPSIYMPFAAGKTVIFSIAVALATLFLVLSVLRDGSLTLRIPLALLGAWLIAIATLASALLSGDVRDSLFGDALDSYTAFFALLTALIMTLCLSFAGSRASIIKLYGVLIGSALVLTLFHLARLVFGPETLSFSLFNGATASLI